MVRTAARSPRAAGRKRAGRVADRLPVPVDDPPAGQVVRRKLDLDPVAGEDLDAVAPHLPSCVAERLVAVVERDAKHPAAKRLDDLAFQLDLLFLLGDDSSLDQNDVERFRALLTLTRFELDLCTLSERLEAVAADAGVVDEEILAAVLRCDEAVALRIVEPLDCSCCHVNTPPYRLITNGKRGAGHRS